MAPSSPILLNLQTLLPTLTPLPTELTSLAASLLSQSKSHAPHLKPDEEIARVYACCDIAVDRLQSKLGLERGTVRPPVPPRVYGKLRGYLDGVLGKGPGTPKGAGRTVGQDVGSVGGSGAATWKKTPESRPTSMRKKWAEARKPKPSPAAAAPAEEHTGLEVPDYAMPMIRRMCQACDTAKAAPHVYTGVSVVLKEFGQANPTGESWVEKGMWSSGRTKKKKKQKRGASAPAPPEEEDLSKIHIHPPDIPAVIFALFTAVVRKMYPVSYTPDGSGMIHKLNGQQHVDAAKEFAADDPEGFPSVAKLNDHFNASPLIDYGKGKKGEGATWLNMEWFGNVPAADVEDVGEAAGDSDGKNNDEDGGGGIRGGTPVRKRPAKTPLRRKEKHGRFVAGDDDDGYTGRAGLLPGLGTMFQPAVDWLSEDRTAEYRRWEKEMRMDMRAIEKTASAS